MAQRTATVAASELCLEQEHLQEHVCKIKSKVCQSAWICAGILGSTHKNAWRQMPGPGPKLHGVRSRRSMTPLRATQRAWTGWPFCQGPPVLALLRSGSMRTA